MTKPEIFAVVREQLLSVIPDLDPDRIVLQMGLRDLGANSVDRADIVMQTLEALQLNVPLHQLASVKNIGELVDALHARQSDR